MRAFLSLCVLSITLALCQAACFHTEPIKVVNNGVEMIQEYCLDHFDESKHPSGSEWNTADCMKCSCQSGEMTCCDRYGGVAVPPEGCQARVNPKTCQYEIYQIADPTKPC